MFGEVGTALIRVLAKVRNATTASTVALLSVAEQLLKAMRAGLVADVARVKNTMIEDMEARTAEQKAKAQKTRAEAAVLSATALKTLSEAAEIANRTPAAKNLGVTMQTVVEQELQRALSALRRDGGDLAADSGELKRLIEPRRPERSDEEP